MNRKLIRAVLCAVMVSVLAVGCGGGDSGNADRGEDTGATTPSDDKDAGVKMGFVVGTFEQDFYRTLGSAIERKVQELGVEAIVTDAELDRTWPLTKYRIWLPRVAKRSPSPVTMRQA
ncbi:MAG: hypothetical protein ACLSEX_08500 [Blautia sp.]